MESTDVPLYLHPVQAVFLALLPLAVFDALGTVAANFLAERQARRQRPLGLGPPTLCWPWGGR